MLIRAALFLVLICTLGAATENPNAALKRIVLADSEVAALAVKPDPADSTVVFVKGLPLLENADFTRVILPFVGKPISSDTLNKVADAIANYARAHDRLITKVQVPNQVVHDGTVRLVVIFGHFKDVVIRNNRWFSSKVLEERLGIKPGDEVRLSVLEEAVNWANTNPFRRVKVLVNPIANQPGKADLIVGVEETAPWRVSGSVDNYGNTVLGQWHYAAAVQAGNLWGRDHQASYQFVTTDNIDLYQAHVVSYRVPLPWRHFLDFDATYVRVNATLNKDLSQSGRNESADLKYTVPIRNGDDPIEVHTGIDFKRGNNNLEYAGTYFFPTNVDTFQLSSGGSLVRHDKHGATAVVLAVNLSPGGIDAHNTTRTYQSARFGSNPTYIYGNLSLQRLTSLGKGWDLTNRLTGQISSTNLQGSEQLAAGGPTSVRGFNTNIYAADEGYVLSNDLLTPAVITPLQRLGKKVPPLETRFAAFYDTAELWQKNPIPSDLPMRPLASAGLGVRMNISNYFSLNFDYGWQITHLPEVFKNTSHGHGHIKVVLAF